jgi:TIR domain
MTGIFINYRREDSAGFAGRLADDLKESFGPDLVFMDVTNIAPGVDFRKVIEQKVGACDVVLAVIGKSWLTCLDAGNQPRLQSPRDFVHLELASALKRDIPVIPILVDGAAMPAATDLPGSLEALAWRNAVELRHAQWRVDIQSLVASLRTMLPSAEQSVVREPNLAMSAEYPTKKPRLPWKFVVPIVVAIAVGALLLTLLMPARKSATQSSAAEPSTKLTQAEIAVSAPAAVTGNDAQYPATLPAGAEATLGTAIYKILAARLERRSTERVTLTFVMRMTNRDRFDANFSKDAFRLQVGDELRTPINNLNELVESKSALEGEVVFIIEPVLRRAHLQIINNKETTFIPIDFASAKMTLPPVPVRTALPGPFPMPLPFGQEAPVNDAMVRVLKAEVVRRSPEKLALHLSLRMTAPRFGEYFGRNSFRLLVDGVPRAPISGPSKSVGENAPQDGEILFVFDDTTESIVLLIHSRSEVTKIAFDLKLQSAKRS